MPKHETFGSADLESISRCLGDTDTGMTGSEIGRLLSEVGIADVEPGITKWKRLLAALTTQQRCDRCSNNVLRFVEEAMNPIRFVKNPSEFEYRRMSLNRVLSFSGIELNREGKLIATKRVTNLSQAEERAGKLRAALLRRDVHSDVLRFCSAELLADNYFHAVLEATKSVCDKLRGKSGLRFDGAELVDRALSLGKKGVPRLAFNSLQTQSEISEQNGIANLMKGLLSTFRNTTAHSPKISWVVTEQDALDLLIMASFLHRRLDSAVRTPDSLFGD